MRRLSDAELKRLWLTYVERAEYPPLRTALRDLLDDLRDARTVAASLAARVARQSDLLGRRAEDAQAALARTHAALCCCPPGQDAGCGCRSASAEELAARWRELQRGWQPIDSAPRDGTGILLGWFPGWPADAVAVGHWRQSHGLWFTPGFPAIEPPTHWQPLPQPPRLQDGGGRVEQLRN